jgi:hypothetical protein
MKRTLCGTLLALAFTAAPLVSNASVTKQSSGPKTTLVKSISGGKAARHAKKQHARHQKHAVKKSHRLA